MRADAIGRGELVPRAAPDGRKPHYGTTSKTTFPMRPVNGNVDFAA
jgi:hypothetical protein